MIDVQLNWMDVDIQNVTSEEIGRCHKIYDEQLQQWVWMVESESDPTKEYRTWWDAQRGPQCLCPAGQEGFVHCRLGCCKHIRWCAAAIAEEASAIAEQVTMSTQPVVSTYTNVDAATMKRVQASKGQPVTKKATLPVSRPFSILKIA